MTNDSKSMSEIEDFITSNREAIGQSVAHLRKGMNITQEDIVNQCGITAKTLWKIEHNAGNYSIDSLLAVLATLGMRLFIHHNDDNSRIPPISHFDVIIKFLIALPFIPIDDLYDVLFRIQFDFNPDRLFYIMGELSYLIKIASENEHSKRIIDYSYEAYNGRDAYLELAESSNSEIIKQQEEDDAYTAFVYLQEKKKFAHQYTLDNMFKMHLRYMIDIGIIKKEELLRCFL